MNLCVYNIIGIEDWTYDNLVENYRVNLERKDLSHILDNIKKRSCKCGDLDLTRNEKKKGTENCRLLKSKYIDKI